VPEKDIGERPRLRSLEAFPVEHEGQRMIGLRDPAGFTEEVVLLPVPLLDLVSLLDGQHSVPEIQALLYAGVAADGDARRICGLSPLYTFLRALPGVRGRLLRYSQWPDPGGAVTFCAAAFP
jgi:hypothetical protein